MPSVAIGALPPGEPDPWSSQSRPFEVDWAAFAAAARHNGPGLLARYERALLRLPATDRSVIRAGFECATSDQDLGAILHMRSADAARAALVHALRRLAWTMLHEC